MTRIYTTLTLLALCASLTLASSKTGPSSNKLNLSFGHIFMAIFGVILIVGLIFSVLFKDRNKPFQVPIPGEHV